MIFAGECSFFFGMGIISWFRAHRHQTGYTKLLIGGCDVYILCPNQQKPHQQQYYCCCAFTLLLSCVSFVFLSFCFRVWTINTIFTLFRTITLIGLGQKDDTFVCVCACVLMLPLLYALLIAWPLFKPKLIFTFLFSMMKYLPENSRSTILYIPTLYYTISLIND